MEKNIGKVKAGMKFVFWYSTGNVEGRVLGFEDDSGVWKRVMKEMTLTRRFLRWRGTILRRKEK